MILLIGAFCKVYTFCKYAMHFLQKANGKSGFKNHSLIILQLVSKAFRGSHKLC